MLDLRQSESSSPFPVGAFELLLLAGVLLVVLYVSARRATTIAELVVENGIVQVVRGGVAPSVLGDLRDVVRRPAIAALHIRIHRSGGRAEIAFRGKRTLEQEQRIRNVIGSVPLARLINRG